MQRQRMAARMGWPLALAVGFSAPAFAQTLPQGGNVVGGSGTITQTNANQLTINQASQNLAIDWQSFSIGANNIVRFVQPSTSAVALNRVLNGDPSQIYGQIQANGQVVIMSPNGIVFGPNSRVDVNALVATTANISTLDFMAGKLLFDQASSDANARVVNQGVISVAQGGFAVLAAASVSNQGQIIANGGTVVLGGTKTFAIDFHGDGLLKFAATGVVDQKPAGADALVENSGSIEANGGRVLLTARAARSVLDNVINTTGIVVARTASLVNGEIVIDGGDAGIVSVNGTLDASGANAGESGGTVKVLGEKVGLFENARIDAAGNAGGGTVLVGGNYQGRGPEANAQYLYMDARAVIDASSAAGDGGRVILWSDLATRNAGHIDVSGARNGGFIEVSSKGFLDFRGTVNLRGLAGRGGELLLDPTDITISSSASSGDMSASSPFAGTAATSNLDVAVLNAALAGGDVTVTTASAGAGTGNIDITASIVNSVGGRTLTLRADGAITVGAGGYISSGGYLFNVSLRAAGSITIGGTGIATSGGNITTESVGGGGQAGGNFVSTANINAGAGNVTLAHVGSISIGGTINTTGQLSINAGGATTQTAAITGPASLAIGGTGAVTLANAGNSFSNILLSRTGTTTNVSIVNAISGNFQTSTLGSGTFTYSSATAGFLQSGGITQDVGGGAVSISGGTGFVTLGQANSFSGPVTVTGDTITVSAAQTATGTGSLSLAATTKLVVNADLTTDGGNITLWGNAPGGTPSGSPSSGLNVGVALQRTSAASVTIEAGGGDISIAGAGGNGGTYSHGVLIDGVVVQTSGAGAITVVGKGGASAAGAEQVGVYINGDTALSTAFSPGTALTSGSGGITLTGTGGVNGSGGANFGVRIARATLTATGGSITAVGTGGAGANSTSIEVAGASLLATGSGGQILLQGQAPMGTGTGISLRNSFDGASTAVAIGGGSFLGDVLLKADSLTNTATTLTISRQTMGGSATFEPYSAAIGVTFNAAGAGLALTSGILSSVSNFATLIAGTTIGTGTLSVGSAYTAPTGVNLQLNSGGAMTVGSALTTAGTGSLTLNSARNVVVSANLTTAGGDILITGNVAFWAPAYETTTPGFGTASGSFDGVAVNAGVSINANGGDIAIAGKGGNTGANQHGVRIYAAAATPTTISTTGAGTITIFGEGGQSTANAGGGLGGSHGGFRFDGDATGVVDVSTVNGNIKMVGAGGGVGATSDNNGGGIFFHTKVRATGLGSIDIVGTPGVGASVGLAALLTQTEISAVSGNIALTGTSGAAYVNDAAFAGSAKGLWLSGATVRTTGTGSVTLRGIEGTQGPGILISNANGTSTLGDAAMNGDLTLRTNSLTYTGTNTITNAGGGRIVFRTDTDATTIGVAGGAGTLQVPTSILSAVTGFFNAQIGSISQTGTITAGAGWTLARSTTLMSGPGNVTVGSVALAGSQLTFNVGGAVSQTGAITGSGSVYLAGAGNTTLNNGGNSFTDLSFQMTGTAGSVNIATTGALFVAGSTIGTGALTLTGAGFSQGGTGIVQDAGGGAVTIAGGAGAVSLNRANSWTGDFTATGSSVAVSAAQTLARVGSQSFSLTGTSGNVLIQANVAKTNTGGAAMSIAAFETAWFDNAGLSSNGGAITIWGNAPGGSNSTGTSVGTAWGVRIDGASAVISAGAGAISIVGKGSTDSGSGQHGIAMLNGGSVQTTTGAISMQGRGGDGTAIGQMGIVLANGTVQSSSGFVTLTGWGGANSSSDAHGIYVDGSVASATGNVSLVGTAPTATAVYIFGGSVSVGGSGTLTLQGSAASGTGIEGGTGSTITTGTGALTLISDRDVSIANTLLTTGGALNVNATGGINLSNAANAIDGTTTVTATGASSTLNFRNIAATRNLTVTSAGDLGLYDLAVTGNLTASAAGVLTVNTPVTMAGGNVTLTATGAAADIQIQGAVTLSNGFFTANSARSIAVTANIATSGGAIDMYANAPGGDVNAGTGTGSFHGVRIDGNITVNAGGGNIDIRGRAGDSGSFHGVTIRNGAGVLTSGSGNLNIMGHGGTSAGSGSAGVEFYAGGAYAQTQNGALTVSGYGSTGGGNNNVGVAMATGEIRATGNGTVNVSGAGGAGGSFGVSVQGGGTTLISSTNGDLTVTGNGGTGSGGGFESWGVNVAGQSGQGTIQSTGTGNLAVTGTAGGTTGDNRYGVIVGTGGNIVATSAAAGTLSVTGTGGAGTGTEVGNHGIYLAGTGATISANGFNVSLNGTAGSNNDDSDGIRLNNGANTHSDAGLLALTGVGSGNGFGIAATGASMSTIGDSASTGNISLIADKVSLSAVTLGIETSGQVLFRPLNSGTTIGVGGGAGTLQLPSDMGFVDAGLLVLGDVAAGAIEVGAGGVTLAAGVDFGLRGASIALTGNVILGAVDTLTLYANTGGVTQAAGSNISAGSLVLRGAGDFEIDRGGDGINNLNNSTFNNITNVAADVTGDIFLRTGTSGGSSSNALTDGIGPVNGISTTGNLTWAAANALSQTAAGGLSVTGVTNLTAQNGAIDMSHGVNTFVGAITATNTSGGISLDNTGNTVFGNVVSNGVLNVSVTGGTLSQVSSTAITTTGNATLTLAGAYAMTLTESGNNVGGNLALSGSTGTLNGTLGGTVTVTSGTFVVNGNTLVAGAPPPTNNTTPAPGAGVGGTSVSSALTDAAPISQIQGAANLPPPPPPGAAAAGSSALALLTGGPGPLVGGGPAGPGGQAEGGEGGPAVSPVGVVVAPPAPAAAAAPGAPAPAASGAPPPPAIVTSGGPPPGPGAPPLVPTTAPPPAVTAVTNVGGASAPAVNGGAVPPTTSTSRTAVTSPFPSLSF